MLRSKKTLAALMSLAVASVVVFVVSQAVSGHDHHDHDHASEIPVGAAQSSSLLDVSGKQDVADAADNVFVGQVSAVEDKVTSSPDAPKMPQSQFAVRVDRNLKGDLAGTVTVNQAGGYAEFDADRDYPEYGLSRGDRVRQLIVVNGDSLLEPGQQYLFATAYNPEQGWHELVAPRVGDVEIEDAAQREAIIESFE